MPNKNYSRNAEEKLEVVKYTKKHSNAAAAKYYDTDEALILRFMWIDIKGVDWD